MQVKKLVLGLAAAFSLFVHGGTMLLNSGDTLVFMGDSITQFGNENNHGYVRLVMAGLQANDINVTYFGKGVSGQTAVEMKNRFQTDVIANNPKVVTIFAGVNDCSKKEDTGWPNDTTSSPDDVAAMVAMALEENITPVLLSPTSHGGEEFRKDICDYAAAVKKIAEDNHIPYVPTYETFRDYVDDVTNPKVNSQYKLTADGTHMSFIGNRMLARLVLRAFGFTDTEMAKAEAAWNLIPRVETLHPSVMITENEYKSIKVAAAAAGRPLSGYLNDLVYHGAELVAQTPARVSATQGATMSLTTTAPITFAQADDLLDCGREMTTHDSMPSVANYALLAAVQALPAVTDADLPSEPVETLDTTVFAKQVEFTCSGYTGTSALSGFPVAVRLAAGSPSGFAYSDMNDSTKGDELRFADDEGNSLPYEIESWDPDGTSLVWVKIPSLTAATSFTMYYGGEPTDAVAARWTWQAGDYVGVWHMSEPSGNVNDSVNGIVGEPTGHAADTMQVASDGVFGKGRVNSTNSNTHSGQSMLLVDDSSLLDFGSVFTFSGWAKMTALPADGLGCLATRHKGGSYAPVWEVRLSDYTTLDVYSGSKTPVSGTIPSAQNAWVHIAGVFDGSTLKAYANGTKVIEQTIDPVQDCDFKMVFGAKEKEWVCGHFVGLFDEFRIREAASSDDWVKAEYDQSKTTFLAAGEVTDVTGGETHTHTWGEPSYTWTQTTSGYECKATVTCTSVTSHTKSMTVTAEYCVVTPATADTDGLGRYTATFTVAPFTSTATNDVVILKTGSGEDEEEEDDPPHDDPEGALASSGDSTGATDVAVIQAAIDAAAPVHGKVTLGSGVFYINAQLMVTNGVTLAGQGWERTVIRQTATPGDDTRVATVKGGATLSQLTVTGGHIDTTANNRFGGGVLLTDGTVSWCCISNNCVSGGNTVYGGGIAIQSSKGRIDHCLIADNGVQASGSTAAGGGIGIYCPTDAITIEACLVRDNRANSTSKHAGNGGGIGIEFSGFRNGVTVRNVTIVGNRAGEVVENDTHVSLGGGLWANPDKSKRFAMTNCIIANNTTVNSGSEAYFTPTDEAYSGGVDYCHFGTVGDLTGDHSTSGDPKFTNASAGDYTLASDSPARGAGTAVAANSKDLAGIDFANPPSMGCYEYDGSTPPTPHTHVWGTPVYNWATDNATCTASATCTGNSAHQTNETVTAQYEVVTPATETEDGLGRFTAAFESPFATQTNDVVILKTGSGEDEEEEEDPPHDDPEGALASSGDSTGATDVAVIQAAIDAAAPVHGKVTLGSGVFYINAQLMVTNGVTLTGQGWERTIIRQTATPGDDTRVATVKGGATLSQLTVTGGHIDTTANNRFGGGVLLTDGTVSWCCISNNCVSGGNTVYGGGIAIQSSKGRIDHCLIADNVARTSSSSVAGGGIGIYCPTDAITIEACLVRDNRANSTSKHAGNGGGIGIEFSGNKYLVTVRNVTIVGNRAGEVVENDTHVSLGGGLWANPDKSKRFTMTNCIIANNTTVNSGSEVYFTPTDEAYSGGVDYCHFGTVGDLTGDHSTSGDPKFTNASAGDYTLASDSPARGAGTAVAAESKDLTGADFANPPSMGCYEFGSTPPSPFEPISLGEVVTRPSTNYNGNAVSVAFSGELPDGAAVSAKITIDDTDYAGTVDPESGSLTFAIPDDAATAGNVYAGTITLTVGDDDYSKGVTLTQASVKVVEETDWIKESATMFESTGSWTGAKAEVVSGKISVSNATFTAATPALASSVVTIDTTVVFGDASEDGFETSPRAGVMIVKAGGKDRYAFKTATGAVTNTTVTAKAGMAVNVIMTLDTVANTVAYTVDGTDFGTYAMTAKDDPVSTVRYVGPTEISSLDGAYRFEGLDSNLAKADGVEYATVEEAVAAGNGVELLWDATWTPTAAGDYVFTKHDFVLAIGGSFAYSVKDNGDGTVTVSVSGGEEPEPEAASITLAGGVVKVGVTDVSPDCWYALEKTTDLTQDFVVDVKTWTKGDALLAGDGTLSIALGEDEPQAFYRVVVSTTAP